MTSFSTKPAHIITLVDYSPLGYVAIAIDGEEVAYIDQDGLNLLPECHAFPDIIDEKGYIKINKMS